MFVSVIARSVAARSPRRGGVLTLDHPPIELDSIFAAYPAACRPPAKVRAFIDFLADRFAPVPPWEREALAPERRRGG